MAQSFRLYKCIDEVGTTKVMAIIDTKKTIDAHAIAQLVGYYSPSEVKKQLTQALRVLSSVHSKNQWVDITHFLGLKFCNSNNPSHGSV